jgi:hypothetical protein
MIEFNINVSYNNIFIDISLCVGYSELIGIHMCITICENVNIHNPYLLIQKSLSIVITSKI